MPDLIAHHARQAVNAIGFFGTLRHGPLQHEAFGTVSAAGNDSARRNQHARAGNDALIDGLLQLDVGVCGAFGPKVTNGGEPGQQGRAQMIGGARHPQR
jgi:hypothetical protein